MIDLLDYVLAKYTCNGNKDVINERNVCRFVMLPLMVTLFKNSSMKR